MLSRKQRHIIELKYQLTNQNIDENKDTQTQNCLTCECVIVDSIMKYIQVG